MGLPALARSHRVYAPDLPGSGGSAKPTADYSPAFFAHFVGAFLDALRIDRAAVIGNSLGGLAGLRLSLSEPERVAALGLVDSAGLGREVAYSLRSLVLPGYGKLAVAWGKRPQGRQRALASSALLSRVPGASLACASGMAQGAVPAGQAAWLPGGPWGRRYRPGRSQRSARGPGGSASAAACASDHRLGSARQGILPCSQAQEARKRLPKGSLELIVDCGHLPHIEHPERFVASLGRFLSEKA